MTIDDPNLESAPTAAPERISTDYLVIGSGAMGMAFADIIATETNATVTLVDKHDRPGGHWNDAYPFVRLHQPSAFYGVSSRRLGNNAKDKSGWNKGLYELASGSEVCTYFEQVMQRTLLPTGRVQYFPMCEYLGDNRFRSLLTGASTEVEVARKVVDATYMNVQVPSVRGPLYQVADGVNCIPLNELPRSAAPGDGYVVVGAGKTGIDACLWLLRHGVAPGRIRWIMPRDSWYLNRRNIQPGAEFLDDTLGGQLASLEAILQAHSISELLDGLTANKQLLRLSQEHRPTMYRCATVTETELEALRTIDNVVRMGHVQSITQDEIVLDQGSIPTNTETLHVDCTADGLARRPAVPIFAGQQITLQSVSTCQQVFSAGFIGHLEHSYDSDEEKNALCTPVPHPNTEADWLRTQLTTTLNNLAWAQQPQLSEWLSTNRLNFGSHFAKPGKPPSAELQTLVARRAQITLPAITKLEELLALAE